MIYDSNSNTIGGTASGAGNVISGNAGNGIQLNPDNVTSPFAQGNLIEGNFIGVSASGIALANGGDGIFAFYATANTIGGTAAGAGNIFAGNHFFGVEIDYSSQNLVAGNLVGITESGSAVANGLGGVSLGSASSNTIGGSASGAGNVISGNSANGLQISGATATGNLVAGNYIGTNQAGTAPLPNSADGVLIENGATANTIGGLASGAGNVISGNDSNGVEIDASDNLVVGNFIGTNAAGTGAIGNACGVYVGAASNTIGGTTAAARNVISANGLTGISQGIDLAASNTLIEGNYIGTDVTGTVALGNHGQGIWATAGSNTVGGTASGAGNLISGNTVVGIWFDSGDGNLVEGNLVGTDVTGARALGNIYSGIQLQSNNNIVGGTTAAARNVVSGNGFNTGSSGIVVLGSGNLVEGNYVGTNAAGTAALGNSGDGIDVSSSANTIGGATGTPGTGAGNVISGNAGFGLVLEAGSSGNIVLGNIVGLTAAGTAAVANGYGSGLGDGIEIAGASSNTIGGTIAADRNIISGNVYRGIELDTPATANLVEGNFIGTDITGALALGNGAANVYVAASGNTIGGTVTGAGNVIAGSGSYGVRLATGAATGNLVAGNEIGTNAAGTAAVPNAIYGIYITSALNNTIGGTAAAAANVISGNFSDGININDGSGNLVEGNKIGTSAAGTAKLANVGNGITINSGGANNTIGGTAAGASNLISGNAGDGVEITGAGSTGNVVAGNLIGTNAAGTAALTSGLMVGATAGGYFGELNLSTGQFTEIAAPGIAYEDSLTSGPGGSFYAGASNGDLYSISSSGVMTQFGSLAAPVPTGGSQRFLGARERRRRWTLRCGHKQQPHELRSDYSGWQEPVGHWAAALFEPDRHRHALIRPQRQLVPGRVQLNRDARALPDKRDHGRRDRHRVGPGDGQQRFTHARRYRRPALRYRHRRSGGIRTDHDLHHQHHHGRRDGYRRKCLGPAVR